MQATPNKTLQAPYVWAVPFALASSRRTMRPNTPAMATRACSVSTVIPRKPLATSLTRRGERGELLGTCSPSAYASILCLHLLPFIASMTP